MSYIFTMMLKIRSMRGVPIVSDTAKAIVEANREVNRVTNNWYASDSAENAHDHYQKLIGDYNELKSIFGSMTLDEIDQEITITAKRLSIQAQDHFLEKLDHMYLSERLAQLESIYILKKVHPSLPTAEDVPNYFCGMEL